MDRTARVAYNASGPLKSGDSRQVESDTTGRRWSVIVQRHCCRHRELLASQGRGVPRAMLSAVTLELALNVVRHSTADASLLT